MSGDEQGLLFALPKEEEPPPEPLRPPDLLVYTVVPRGEFKNDFYEVGRAWHHKRTVWVKLHAIPTSAAMVIAKPERAERLIAEVNRKART